MVEMVYVVFAAEGERSDSVDWPVVVVRSEKRAKEVIAFLDAEARSDHDSTRHHYETCDMEL